jgi:hypothetical protein
MVEATRKPPKPERCTPHPSAFKAADAILKGLEISLPRGLSFTDKEGCIRKEVRLRWWDPDAFTFRQASICDDNLRRQLPDEPIPQHFRIGYRNNKPVFFGHYWLREQPAVQSEKVACLDYSVADEGALVAYRWNGEAELSSSNLVPIS